jgi:hypothetical protein
MPHNEILQQFLLPNMREIQRAQEYWSPAWNLGRGPIKIIPRALHRKTKTYRHHNFDPSHHQNKTTTSSIAFCTTVLRPQNSRSGWGRHIRRFIRRLNMSRPGIHKLLTTLYISYPSLCLPLKQLWVHDPATLQVFEDRPYWTHTITLNTTQRHKQTHSNSPSQEDLQQHTYSHGKLDYPSPPLTAGPIRLR